MKPGKSVLKIIDFDEFSNDCEYQFIAENDDFGNNPQCRLREKQNLTDRECEDHKCEKCETTNLAHLKKHNIDLYNEWVKEIEESGHSIEEFTYGSKEFSMDLNHFFTEYRYVLVYKEAA
jgi:hypothetical protein